MKVSVVAYYDWAGASYNFTSALNEYSKHEALFFRFHNIRSNYPTMYEVTENNRKEAKKTIESCDVLWLGNFCEPIEELKLDTTKFDKVILCSGASLFRIKRFRERILKNTRKLVKTELILTCFTADMTFFEPSCTFIPQCTRIDELRNHYDYGKRNPSLITHDSSAVFSKIRWYVGTKEFKQVISKLRKKFKFKSRTITGVTNDRCLHLKAPASICFDRFFITYGISAQESAAFESAVLTGIDPYVLDKIKKTTGHECPFLVTIEKDDLECHLTELLEHPDYLDKVRSECYDFARAVHDGRLTVKTFNKIVGD